MKPRELRGLGYRTLKPHPYANVLVLCIHHVKMKIYTLCTFQLLTSTICDSVWSIFFCTHVWDISTFIYPGWLSFTQKRVQSYSAVSVLNTVAFSNCKRTAIFKLGASTFQKCGRYFQWSWTMDGDMIIFVLCIEQCGACLSDFFVENSLHRITWPAIQTSLRSPRFDHRQYTHR